MPNPTLKDEVFNSLDNPSDSLALDHAMTKTGTLNKTLFLGVLLAISAFYTWYLVNTGFADKANILTTVGAFGGLIMALIICFGPKNKFLSLTTPIYALFEGLFIGGISAIFNKYYPGIVIQAMIGTIFAILGMYIAYSTKLIQATSRFMKTIMIATTAIMGIYLLQIILMFFHTSIPQIFSNSPLGIGFSVIVCIIAALNLIIDFEIINQYNGRVPEYMEWYCSFSLMVTIVWLYLEILKLLAKLNSRR